MDRRPLEGLLILFVWVALSIAMNQLGTHKRIRPNASEKPPVVTSTRLPFRFSLGTLLITVTAVAVVLGLVVWAVR
jgi:hypothetical protein